MHTQKPIDQGTRKKTASSIEICECFVSVDRDQRDRVLPRTPPADLNNKRGV